MIFRVADQVVIPTYFRELTRSEIKTYRSMSKGWVFDWNKPMTLGYQIFGLTDGSNEYQGLIALRANTDPDYLCVDVEIIESAPWNKKSSGKRRVYVGVGKQLVAFACQYSVDCGLDGCVQLTSKSSKINFYESMGASSYSHLMIFDEISGKSLAKKYFPGGVKWWTK